MKVLSPINDGPEIVELEEFFWLDDEAGWAFGFGDETEHSGYGLFPSDFVEIDTNYESDIAEFLSTKEPSFTSGYIGIDQFLEHIKNNRK